MSRYIEIARDYSYAALRVGLTVRRSDGAEIYIQPGDDETAMRENIDALDEIPFGGKRDAVAHIMLSEYFDGIEPPAQLEQIGRDENDRPIYDRNN